MEKLDSVIKHLRDIGKDFYGEVRIKIKAGRAVLITEERTIKLEDFQLDSNYESLENISEGEKS